MNTNGIGGPPPHMGRMFERFDADGDGQLNESELTKFAQGMPARGGQGAPSASDMMERLDTDGDGQISQDEFRAGRPPGPPPPPPGQFGSDSYGGTLDASQLEAMAARFSQATGQTVSSEDLLAALDTDGDGSVSGEEMHEHHRSMQAQMNSGFHQAMMRRR